MMYYAETDFLEPVFIAGECRMGKRPAQAAFSGCEYRFLETAGQETLELIARARDLTREYYLTDYRDTRRRTEILREPLGGIGENVAVDAPFHCDHGKNIFLGSDVIINMNYTFVDVASITIGSRVLEAVFTTVERCSGGPFAPTLR